MVLWLDVQRERDRGFVGKKVGIRTNEHTIPLTCGLPRRCLGCSCAVLVPSMACGTPSATAGTTAATTDAASAAVRASPPRTAPVSLPRSRSPVPPLVQVLVVTLAPSARVAWPLMTARLAGAASRLMGGPLTASTRCSTVQRAEVGPIDDADTQRCGCPRGRFWTRPMPPSCT